MYYCRPAWQSSDFNLIASWWSRRESNPRPEFLLWRNSTSLLLLVFHDTLQSAQILCITIWFILQIGPSLLIEYLRLYSTDHQYNEYLQMMLLIFIFALILAYRLSCFQNWSEDFVIIGSLLVAFFYTRPKAPRLAFQLLEPCRNLYGPVMATHNFGNSLPLFSPLFCQRQQNLWSMQRIT